MTPEDEAFLTEVHRNLDKEAIGPESPFFVHLEELPGNVLGQDPVPRLATSIRRSTAGSMFFLTGLRGSGKSSQLRRLAQNLRRDGFAVLLLDAEDYLDLRRPLALTDMLFFLVGAISDQAVQNELLAKGNAVESVGWSRLWAWLTELPGRMSVTGATAEIGAKLPLVEGKLTLKAELRNNPTFVGRLREFLDGRSSELVVTANTIVKDMVENARKRWQNGEWKGVVVIVDSLDHNRAFASETFHEVRRALVNLFDLDRAKLALSECRMVFTMPSHIKISGTGSRQVTNVKVADQHGERYLPGVKALREVLRKRVPGGKLDRIFPDEHSLDRLICCSGGHLRMLLGLAMEVITQAETLPVDKQTLQSSIDAVRNSLLPLSEDQRVLLRRVAVRHELPLDSQDEWNVVADLIDQRLVLGYQNGRLWYDVHPLLKGEISEISDDRRES
jgi:hypothetical protein